MYAGRVKTGLCIGLNAVDPRAYKGWSGELWGCVADARANAGLYAQHGFTMLQLINEDAHLDRVRDSIKQMAYEANAGDSVVITNSSHGARYSTPFIGSRETICYWNGQMSDSEFHNLLCRFKPGVRVIVELDFCHSGGFDRAMRSMVKTRAMPRDWAKVIPPPEQQAERGTISASVLMTTACEPDELAGDGWDNGVFTKSRMVAREEFSDVPIFREWFQATQSLMLRENPQQHPIAHRLGPDTIWDTQIG